MSQTEQILDEFVESQGWSDKTVLDLALTYIDNQENHADWRDYLESLKAVDDEMDDGYVADNWDEKRMTFLCRGCGRPEGDCSKDPCPDVIKDRES